MNYKSKLYQRTLFGLTLLYITNICFAEGDCPPMGGCAPCGEAITNIPMPSYDCNRVQPFQNYLATGEYRLCGGWNGLYLGTGFGYGAISYNLKIPGVTLPSTNGGFSNTYIIEYATLGFAHSSNRFFIGGELGYYYNSVTSPLFYEDMSSVTMDIVGDPPDVASTTRISPCTVRLDINAHNHFALDILPGFIATPRLTLFSRLGFEYTQYSWKRRVCFPQVTVLTEDTSVEIDVNDPALIQYFDEVFGDVTDSKSDSVVDFRLGAGASFAAGPHLSFNVNYIHVFGSKASFNPNVELFNPNLPFPFATGVVVTTTDLHTLAAQNTIDPSRNEILFGMTLSL